MSMESAVQALNASNIDSKAPTSPAQGAPATPVPKEGPKTLQEAIKPKEQAKPQIGADRFAALAKKERALQKQMSELKAKEARISEFEKLKGTNPLEALKSLGYTYDQLTQFLLNGQQPTPDIQVKQVRDEIEALKQQQIKEKQESEARAKAAAEREYTETINDFNQEIKGFIKTNQSEYELTNMYQGEEIIYATIEQYFTSTGKIMSIKEAADLVEGYFEDQVKAAQKTKKFQGQTKPKDVGQVKAESGVKQASPTLSNEMTSSAPSLLPAKTENARIQRALAALSK